MTVEIESRVSAETIDALRAMGHTVEVLPGWGSSATCRRSASTR